MTLLSFHQHHSNLSLSARIEIIALCFNSLRYSVSLSRLHVFCRWKFCRLLRSTLFEAVLVLGIPDQALSPYYHVLNGFLLVLQLLHIVWFGMILRMCYSFLAHGQVQWLRQCPSPVLSMYRGCSPLF